MDITPIAASARNYPGSGSKSHMPEPALRGGMPTGEQAGPEGTPPKALNFSTASWHRAGGGFNEGPGMLAFEQAPPAPPLLSFLTPHLKVFEYCCGRYPP